MRKAWYHLQTAKEYFEDVIREYPKTVGAERSKEYIKRIEWMKRDFASDPRLPSDLTLSFNKEINGDTLFPAAIAEKVMELPTEIRENFENLLDLLLSGQTITVQLNETNNNNP